MSRTSLEVQNEAREALDRVASLKVRLASTPPGGDAADRLYEVVTDEIVDARERLRTALDELDAHSVVPQFRRPAGHVPDTPRPGDDARTREAGRPPSRRGRRRRRIGPP